MTGRQEISLKSEPQKTAAPSLETPELVFKPVVDIVERDKIDAHCADGTLRLVLPKADKAWPRQIAVKTGR
jgi:hypothetical protein